MKGFFAIGISGWRGIEMLLLVTLFQLWPGGGIFAQTEEALKKFFEGRVVELKMDMPATKDGVDVYPRRNTPVDYSEYGERLKRHGTAIKVGDQIMITKVDAKKKHIEFQLGGGGYGTFWDETDYVPVEYAEKTEREKNLEKAVKTEKDPAKKKKMNEELDALRKEREREDARLRAQAEETRAQKRAEIRQRALAAGSRFNIRHDEEMGDAELTPAYVMQALADYVYFPEDVFGDNPSVAGDAAAASLDSEHVPGTIQKGMTWEEVAVIYGMPRSLNAREVEGTKVTTCIFEKDDQVIEVKFVEGIVAKYSISSK